MSLIIDRVRAIVFDVDNTLITCPSNDEAILDVLRRYGCNHTTASLVLTISAANSDWAIVERCLPEDVRGRAYAEVLARNAFLVTTSKLDEQLKTVLRRLVDRYALLILSGRDRASIDAAMRQHGINELFTDVVGAAVDGAEKPDPRDLLALLKQHAIEPAEAVYVGDKQIDRYLAEAAGTQFVGAAWYEDILPEGVLKAATVSDFARLFR